MLFRSLAATGITQGPLDLDQLEHLLVVLTVVACLPIALYPGPPLTAALPALPAIALLVGRYADRVLGDGGDASLLRPATGMMALTGTAFMVLGLVLATRMPAARLEVRVIAVLVGLVSWLPGLVERRGSAKWAVGLFVLPVALAAPIVHMHVLPALEPWLDTRTIAEMMERNTTATTPLVVLEAPPASLRQSLDRNLVLRTRLSPEDRDVQTPEGVVYVAYRPAREAEARAAMAPLGGPIVVLERTPVMVLARVRAVAP